MNELVVCRCARASMCVYVHMHMYNGLQNSYFFILKTIMILLEGWVNILPIFLEEVNVGINAVSSFDFHDSFHYVKFMQIGYLIIESCLS